MKRLNKRGFTLVELLAVIVILAVLILLAMPSVLKIMENARKSAFETEVRSYLKAAQTNYTELAIDSTIGNTLIFTSSGDKYGEEEEYNCSEDYPCLLDNIDNKDDYAYYIKINVSEGIATYNYYVTNGTYQASSGDDNKSYNSTINISNYVEAECDVNIMNCPNE